MWQAACSNERAAACCQVGSDGVLSIENSNTMETSVEVEEGMSIDRGYVSREMITNQARDRSVRDQLSSQCLVWRWKCAPCCASPAPSLRAGEMAELLAAYRTALEPRGQCRAPMQHAVRQLDY